MPADAPTIVASSGGLIASPRREFDLGPILYYAIDRSGVTGRRPRVCVVGTAHGDQRARSAAYSEAGRAAGVDIAHLTLFTMPNVDDVAELVHTNDVVWVCGGSVANLLAVWQVHNLAPTLRSAWEAGVVMAGVSAGSICWHAGGATDSFGPRLRAVTNGLGLVPFGNGVHYDSERTRRPMIHQLVSEGTLPRTYCTDDGTAVVYVGSKYETSITEKVGAHTYLVEPDGNGSVNESELPTTVIR